MMIAQRISRHLHPAIPLAFLGALLATLLGLLMSVNTDRRAAENRLHHLRLENQHVLQKLGRFERAASTFQQDLDAFNALLKQGIFDAEPRSLLTDALFNATSKLKLPPAESAFQMQSEIGQFAATGGIHLMRSTMAVTIHLLHEQDLLDILSWLAQTPGAALSPRRCTLTREDAMGTPRPFTLKARCEFDWLTLQVPHTTGAP